MCDYQDSFQKWNFESCPGMDRLRDGIAGSAACLVATSLLNPLEVIKIQIQASGHA